MQVLASFNLLRRQAEEPLYNADLVDGVGDEEVRAFSATVDMFENYMKDVEPTGSRSLALSDSSQCDGLSTVDAPTELQYVINEFKRLMLNGVQSSEVANRLEAQVSIDLSDAQLPGSVWSGAQLGWVDTAYLKSVNLYDANLTDTTWGPANLSSADLRCATLANADFSEANLNGALIEGACYSADTQWPPRFATDERLAAMHEC